MPNLLPNSGPKMLLGFGLLALVDFVRHGSDWHYFTQQRVANYVVMALLFLLFAAAAPELANAILFGILILAALGAAGPLADALRRVTASGAASLPSPVTRGK